MLGIEAGRVAWRMVASAMAAVLLAAACGDEPIEPDDTPPDLSGSYTLVSIYIPLAGDTLTPPAVSGTFLLEQTGVAGQEATGTLDTISVSLPVGGIDARGLYRNRFDGTWEQEFTTGTELQALGTYTLQGNILTVVVTEPELAVSTTVWRKQ